jgi:sterol desaturase/sphingolipid hydroxylase (fatty acid hydroxylase superfamily)
MGFLSKLWDNWGKGLNAGPSTVAEKTPAKKKAEPKTKKASKKAVKKAPKKTAKKLTKNKK